MADRYFSPLPLWQNSGLALLRIITGLLYDLSRFGNI
jgi:hypothetical protein